MEVAEDSTEAEGERFAEAEASPGEAGLGSWADARSADFVEAVSIEVAVVSAGVEGIGAEDTGTDGAGDLASGGRIGVGEGAIRMATTTAPGIMGIALIILIRITVLRTILRAIRILTMGTTILRIPMHGRSLTRTDLQDPGDHRYREATRMQTTQTAT